MRKIEALYGRNVRKPISAILLVCPVQRVKGSTTWPFGPRTTSSAAVPVPEAGYLRSTCILESASPSSIQVIRSASDEVACKVKSSSLDAFFLEWVVPRETELSSPGSSKPGCLPSRA